ncbi:MAG: VWA domain-containing protein [Chloroflexi bacterium]|nr:VWA domain-containing protein [Chloroflexota bacterium]
MTQNLLLKNLVLFSRLLRSAGLDVGSGQMIDLAAALEYVDIGKREDVYAAARALFAHRRADLALFDLAFRLFWQSRRLPSLPMPIEPHPALKPKSLRTSGATYREIPDADAAMQNAPASERVLVELQQTFSPAEVLRKKDFDAYTWEEVERAKQMMHAMTWRVGLRRTRRKIRVARGTHLDMRRVIRRNLKYGGEILELAWKETQFKPRPLVVLCDISGSMERYSRMLLHFIHTLSNGLERVDAFLFGTRLTRITRQIQRRDIDQAIGEVVKVVDDWGGGTRIGDAIKTFNQRWARRVAARGAVVLIISDGWDRGDVEILRREMERLQRNCFRLIWLNPLLAAPDYQPLTLGLQAALPYVDDFLPAHNLASLESLGRVLSRVEEKRPARWGKSQIPNLKLQNPNPKPQFPNSKFQHPNSEIRNPKSEIE